MRDYFFEGEANSEGVGLFDPCVKRGGLSTTTNPLLLGVNSNKICEIFKVKNDMNIFAENG